MPNGEYGKSDLYIGLPAIVGGNGVSDILELKLREEESEKLKNTCDIIGDLCHSVKF